MSIALARRRSLSGPAPRGRAPSRALGLALAALGLALLAGCSTRPEYAAISASEPRVARTVEVVGQGEASGPPRGGSFVAVLVAEGTSPNEAWAEGQRLEQRLENVLASAGVRPVDIQPENYDLRLTTPPRRTAGPGQTGEPDGYLMTRRVKVTVLDLARMQKLLAVAMGAGVAYVEQVAFSPVNDPGVRERARQVAIQDALAGAQVLAQQLGLQVGLPEEVVEMRFTAPAGRPEDPFTASCQVRVRFSLKQF